MVAATVQKTFSGGLFALGVTDRRLLLWGSAVASSRRATLDRSRPGDVVSAEMDGAGGGWWTAPSAVLSASAWLCTLRTVDGERTKLMMMKGTGLLGGAGGGESQSQGVSALAEWMAALQLRIGERTASNSQVTVAETSAAPSRWKPTSTSGRSVKYCTKPDRALGQLDRRAARAARRRAVRGARRRARRTAAPTVRPTSRKTASACSWRDLQRVEAVALGVDVAGVRAGAGDDGAEVEHRPGDGEQGPGQRRPPGRGRRVTSGRSSRWSSSTATPTIAIEHQQVQRRRPTS